MAPNDIYKSKDKYLRFLANLRQLLVPHSTTDYRRKYHCKNGQNLKHFKTLHRKFESRDTSYVRRLRLFSMLVFIVHHTKKELSKLSRDDVDDIVAYGNRKFNSEKTRTDFKKNMKFIWKQLFPEIDEKGRIDETLVPYPVRHLSAKAERSRETARNDRLTFAEFERFIAYFASDKRMQAYLFLALEREILPD